MESYTYKLQKYFSGISFTNFYHLEIYCYIHNVSAQFVLRQMFLIELESLHRISNWTLYLLHGVDCSNSVNHSWVQGLLSYSKYSVGFFFGGGVLMGWSQNDREEYWRISVLKSLKEAVYMLGYSDLLSRLSIEMNMIWEPII